MNDLSKESLKILLRADSGIQQGTGHVMRCLTLAEALRARGHFVSFLTAPTRVNWLSAQLEHSGIEVFGCAVDELPIELIQQMKLDWVVIDSYSIASSDISRLNGFVPVLAIVDGDTRGIDATLYLDQNLGAEERSFEIASTRMMRGADFALVRDAVLAARRPAPWELGSPLPSVLCFMGGTDPTGAIGPIIESLVAIEDKFQLEVIAPTTQHEILTSLLLGRDNVQIVSPTPALPRLFGEADVVVSAAGTSAWDVCTLGVPAVLVAVVDNQRESLLAAIGRGLALGVDASVDRALLVGRVGACVSVLLRDMNTRMHLSAQSTKTFDGLGKYRVTERLENPAERQLAVYA